MGWYVLLGTESFRWIERAMVDYERSFGVAKREFPTDPTLARAALRFSPHLPFIIPFGPA